MDLTVAAEKSEDEAPRPQGNPSRSIRGIPGRPRGCCGLYNGMIAPFTPFAIKGFLWYQGETTPRQTRLVYDELLAELIRDWRSHFQQGNLPFLYVQISSFNSPPTTGEWCAMRSARTARRRHRDGCDPRSRRSRQRASARQADRCRAAGARCTQPRIRGERSYQGPLFREASAELNPTVPPAYVSGSTTRMA